MVGPSLTAINTLFAAVEVQVAFVQGTSMIIKIHLPVCLSYRILGSEVKFNTTAPVTGVITDAKNTSGLAFKTPSAAPVVLLKERIRPFTKTMYCVGPTVPILSGGNAPVSFNVAPVKVVLSVCGVDVGVCELPFAVETFASGKLATAFASGFCGRFLRLG